jgi:peptidoglycan/LPS O-acetylase OafA/YrhL
MREKITKSVKTQHYRRDIDGLRGLAVLSVVVYHIAPKGLLGGYVGVDVFFVISDYFIAGLIARALVERQFSFKNFYLARVRRIFPALILVLLSTAVCGWLLLYPDEFRTLGKHLFAGTLSLKNIFLLTESGYFDKDSTLKPFLHLWSLGIEEQFYVFFDQPVKSPYFFPRAKFSTIYSDFN